VSLKVVERGWNADEHVRMCQRHEKGDFEQGAKLSISLLTNKTVESFRIPGCGS
jgi:hypothetical protein